MSGKGMGEAHQNLPFPSIPRHTWKAEGHPDRPTKQATFRGNTRRGLVMMPSHSHLVSPWLMKDLTSGWIRRGGPSFWSGILLTSGRSPRAPDTGVSHCAHTKFEISEKDCSLGLCGPSPTSNRHGVSDWSLSLRYDSMLGAPLEL